MALLRGKWTVAWKYWSSPSSTARYRKQKQFYKKQGTIVWAKEVEQQQQQRWWTCDVIVGVEPWKKIVRSRVINFSSSWKEKKRPFVSNLKPEQRDFCPKRLKLWCHISNSDLFSGEDVFFFIYFPSRCVCLKDSAARIFPNFHATTENRTHVSRVSPDWDLWRMLYRLSYCGCGLWEWGKLDLTVTNSTISLTRQDSSARNCMDVGKLMGFIDSAP